MKNIFIALAIVLALAIGYFAITQSASSQTPDSADLPQSGETKGKLDIDVICKGALAYMTFASSEAADVFVQECKEGKHPDVIDRYKAQLNISTDAAI